jgi:hypothetical protein
VELTAADLAEIAAGASKVELQGERQPGAMLKMTGLYIGWGRKWRSDPGPIAQESSSSYVRYRAFIGGGKMTAKRRKAD